MPIMLDDDILEQCSTISLNAWGNTEEQEKYFESFRKVNQSSHKSFTDLFTKIYLGFR